MKKKRNRHRNPQPKPKPNGSDGLKNLASLLSWAPLVPGELPPETDEEIRRKAEVTAKLTGRPVEECERSARDTIENDEIWINHLYQVNVRRIPYVGDKKGPDLVHLSIKRRDKHPVTDWRHKQFIKNQLVGAECEAVELYPAESRLVDTANQYHLWCVDDPKFRWPFGFGGRLVVDGDDELREDGSRQRKMEE